jgi:midasin
LCERFELVTGEFLDGISRKYIQTTSINRVLLDEINLASPETLEAITPLLQSPTASLTLTEKGSLEPVPRHPAFRLFASMNPATDIGKRDLPPVMRSSFTELWVPAPDADREALLAIISQRIGHIALADGSCGR